MGVRSYTPDMHTTFPLTTTLSPALDLGAQSPVLYTRMPVGTEAVGQPSAWKKAAQVIVDWSQMPKDASADVQLEIDHLMRWIHSYPERTAVHVYLRRSVSVARDRVLQHTLQSLGCRVTMRSPLSIAPAPKAPMDWSSLRKDFVS